MPTTRECRPPQAWPSPNWLLCLCAALRRMGASRVCIGAGLLCLRVDSPPGFSASASIAPRLRLAALPRSASGLPLVEI
ncbi:hypothetical protein BDA96_02G294500 [Sorghum bicolor]|uniref:Uncharacterized protein n=1 Tax=Sorghum bicolor TaxID=4558 RepID=A0A921RR52_SORBI|nr:hypothetical protein BDA96_02G294500 [Sorghum bicolor]